MDQNANGAPKRGSESRATVSGGQDNLGEQGERRGDMAGFSLPTQALEQHAAYQQQVSRISTGYPVHGAYNQQIVENAVQAVAALAAIAGQASHQQLSQGTTSGSHDTQFASLVSSLASQQPGTNLLAAQLGGVLPMMWPSVQQPNPAFSLGQSPGWLNAVMGSSVPYATAAGANLGPMYRPPAFATQEATAGGPDSAANSPALPSQPRETVASQPAEAVAAVARNQRPCVPLFLDYDREVLTEYQCLLRQQIELFEAGPEDIRDNVKGRIKPIRVDQLGMRCRHCKMLPPDSRARGAMYFAYNLEGIYQLAQNMGKKHLCDGCREIPLNVKAQLSQMYRSKENNNRRAGGKAYWVESLAVLGVYKDKTTGMLRLKPPR
jgi:hypothetical protein